MKINKIKIEGIELNEVYGVFGEDKKSILAKDIANIHNKKVKYINKEINNNKNRFKDGIDIIDIKNTLPKETMLGMGFTKAQYGNANNIYLLSYNGYFKLSNLIKENSISKIIFRDFFDESDEILLSQPKEYQFYNLLEKQLTVFGVIDGVKQYGIKGYKIDYYIPSLNVAIEYDEGGHSGYSYDKQEGRQKEIEEELGCRFIRVTDEYDIEIASAKVLKELFFIVNK